MRNMMATRKALTFFTVVMLLSMSATIVSADVDINLSANPSSAEATADEVTEYTIIVQNSGDDDLISLTTQQGDDCNGFSSTLETTFVQVSSSSSESVTLTVTRATEQASGECETTVNAQAGFRRCP